MRAAVWLPAAALLIAGACAGDGDQQPSEKVEAVTRRGAKVDVSKVTAALTSEVGRVRPPEGVSTARWAPLQTFYRQRTFAPVFVDGRGATDRVKDLLASICHADEDGLSPADYSTAPLESALEAARENKDPALLAQAELLAADLYLHFASDLTVGRLNPREQQWTIEGRPFDGVAALAKVADANVEDALGALRPAYPEYRALRKALAQYRELAATGGWPQVPKGKALAPGASDPRVAAVRERLKVTGEFKGDAGADPNAYDDALVEAVKRFQTRHGLEADGKLTAETVASMNVTAERRVSQLVANLERWRWMPQDLGERAVLVNIPGFELQEREGGHVIDRMKVIVGQPDWETPIFSSHTEAVVFNPDWHVPKKILTEEILPKLQQDAQFTSKVGLKVISKEDGAEVDPTTVDWSAVDPDAAMPYKFQQDAGDANPLGHVKFAIPNRYSIYLHDTPEDKKFNYSFRAFSHGCVRVERPEELAAFILNGTPEWSATEVKAMFSDDARSKLVPAAKPANVYLGYFTSWVGDDGQVQFRTDLYRHDSRMIRALEKRSTAEEPPAICG